MEKNVLEKMGLRSQACHHWDPHLAVGLSSLSFLAPAGALSAVALCILTSAGAPYSLGTRVQLVLYTALSVLYVGASVICCLADYTYVRRGHRSAWGKIDRVIATITFALSVLSLGLRAPIHETIVMTVTPVFAFAFSGMSSSLEAWAFRHSLWHLVGGAIGVLGALRHVPEPATTEVCMWPWLQVTELTLFVTALILLSALRAMPQAARHSLWRWGAARADWKPVKCL